MLRVIVSNGSSPGLRIGIYLSFSEKFHNFAIKNNTIYT